MSAEEDAYHELCAYTLTHGDPRFIHQHVVDAFGAQRATPDGKPIRVVFSLVGLYLHLECGKTGRQVQLIHMQMGKRKREWPRLPLPVDRGAMNAIDVMRAPAGAERDQAIDQWCASVWNALMTNRNAIIALLSEYGIS